MATLNYSVSLVAGANENVNHVQTMFNEAKASINSVTNAQIAAAAGIELTKLASGASAQLIVGDGSGVPTYRTLSGDATISNTGVLSLGTDSVGSAEIATDAVGSAEIAASAVGTSEIADNAVTSDKINLGDQLDQGTGTFSTNIGTWENLSNDVSLTTSGGTDLVIAQITFASFISNGGPVTVRLQNITDATTVVSTPHYLGPYTSAGPSANEVYIGLHGPSKLLRWQTNRASGTQAMTYHAQIFMLRLD